MARSGIYGLFPKEATRMRVHPRRSDGKSCCKQGRRAALLVIGQCGVLQGLACLAARPATAQLLDRFVPAGIPGYPDWFAETGAARTPPGTEMLPVHLGSFTLLPALTTSAGYDSKPSSLPNAAGSPFIDTKAEVAAGSDWGSNSLNALLNVDRRQYVDLPAQSYLGWTASVGGNVDIGNDQATAAYSHVNGISLPTQVGSLNITSPIISAIDDGRVSYSTAIGRLTITPGAEIASFSNSGDGENGTLARLDNRIAATARLSLAYAMFEGESLILVAHDIFDRFGNGPDGLPRPDDQDGAVLGGLDYRPDGVLRYRAMVGYETLAFSSRRYSDIAAPAAEADVIWTPTRLTTASLRLTRSLQNGPGLASGNYTYTSLLATVDHELFRNLVLSAEADYQEADQIDATGRQTNIGGALQSRWTINRGLSLVLRYQLNRLHNVAGASGNGLRHIISFDLVLRPGAFN